MIKLILSLFAISIALKLTAKKMGAIENNQTSTEDLFPNDNLLANDARDKEEEELRQQLIEVASLNL